MSDLPGSPERGPSDSAAQVTRRRVLQGAAVVTGAAWVTPVVDSFTSRAAATSAPNLPEQNICDAQQQDLVANPPGSASGTITISVNFSTGTLGYAGTISGLSPGDSVTELDVDLTGVATIVAIANPVLNGLPQQVSLTSAELTQLAGFCTNAGAYSVVVKSANQPAGVAHGGPMVNGTNCCQGYQGGIPNRCYAPATAFWCGFWYGGPYSSGSITGGPCTIKPSGRGCCAGTVGCV